MPDNAETTFEESLARIRAIADELEGGELSLDASIEKYREGSSLLIHARKLITDAELRVRVLSENDVTSLREHE